MSDTVGDPPEQESSAPPPPSPPPYQGSLAPGPASGQTAPAAVYGGEFGPLADWPQRVVATLLDIVSVVVLVVVGVILDAILGKISGALGVLFGIVLYLSATVAAFYIAYLNGATGQSPGKRLTGLKVVQEGTGQLIGGGLGIARYLAHIVDGIICYIGYLLPLWDPKKQTIADKLVRTLVVTGAPKTPLGPELFTP